MKKVTLVEAPLSYGSPTRGADQALNALVKGGLPGLFGENWNILTGPLREEAPSKGWPPHLRDLDTVMQLVRQVYRLTHRALTDGTFPIVIGGDHSCAMGSLAALGEFYGAENLAVVYVDAHTDINTDQTSVTGYIHGMDLAAACGLCCEQLDVGTQKVHLLGKNLRRAS